MAQVQSLAQELQGRQKKKKKSVKHVCSGVVHPILTPHSDTLFSDHRQAPYFREPLFSPGENGHNGSSSLVCRRGLNEAII